MAQVKSILCRSSPAVTVNDASLSEFSLEICDESPPKFVFDIDVLLNDNDLTFNPLQSDRLKVLKNNLFIDNEILNASSEDTCNTSHANMAPAAPSVKIPNFNFNLDDLDLNFSGSSDDLVSSNLPGTGNYVTSDDLSDMLDACKLHKPEPDDCVSLAALAKSHFLQNSLTSSENNFKTSTTFHFPENDTESPVAPDICNNVSRKSDNFNLEFNSLNDLLCYGSEDKSFKANCENTQLLTESEICKDHLIDEIDLSACIKNTSSDRCILDACSDSKDSGFEDSDELFKLTTFSFKDFISANEVSNKKRVKSVLYNPRPSLLSTALSCKPKSDNLKKARVLQARKELCQKYIPTFNESYQNKALKDKFIDRSNCCVISHLVP